MKFRKLISFLLLLMIAGCSLKEIRRTDNENLSTDQCMKALFESSFPVGDDAFTILATKSLELSNQGPTGWQKLDENVGLGGLLENISLITNDDGVEILWGTSKHGNDSQIWSFDLNNKTWLSGPTISSGARLFSDSNNNIWIIEPLHKKPSSLYLLNRKTMLLENQSKYNELFSKHNILEAKPSRDGEVWFVLIKAGEGNQIYKYDDKSHHLAEFFLQEEIVGLEIDSAGFVYAFHRNGRIRRYDPISFEIQDYSLAFVNGSLSAPKIKTLITGNNELWVNDIAKFHIFENGLQNQQVIFRSPVFLTQYFSGYQPLLWERPEPLVDTEDGRIWFRSSRGLAWHQPETGEWCMFTSADSNIVKDLEGNLWLVYDNALYMLPASETRAKED